MKSARVQALWAIGLLQIGLGAARGQSVPPAGFDVEDCDRSWMDYEQLDRLLQAEVRAWSLRSDDRLEVGVRLDVPPVSFGLIACDQVRATATLRARLGSSEINRTVDLRDAPSVIRSRTVALALAEMGANLRARFLADVDPLPMRLDGPPSAGEVARWVDAKGPASEASDSVAPTVAVSPRDASLGAVTIVESLPSHSSADRGTTSARVEPSSRSGWLGLAGGMVIRTVVKDVRLVGPTVQVERNGWDVGAIVLLGRAKSEATGSFRLGLAMVSIGIDLFEWGQRTVWGLGVRAELGISWIESPFSIDLGNRASSAFVFSGWGLATVRVPIGRKLSIRFAGGLGYSSGIVLRDPAADSTALNGASLEISGALVVRL